MLKELKNLRESIQSVLREKKEITNKKLNEINNIIDHYEHQVKDTYKYLVGYWKNDYRAKSTDTGKLVSKKEVITYLQQK